MTQLWLLTNFMPIFINPNRLNLIIGYLVYLLGDLTISLEFCLTVILPKKDLILLWYL